MTPKPRLNKLIGMLERDRVAFGGIFARNGNIDDSLLFADLGYDFIVIDMEHEGFDMAALRLSLQFLLDRREIGSAGTMAASAAPLVRIPPNARERNQWVFKQVLDTGAYGIVLPQLETIADAQAAVAASLYPRPGGSAAAGMTAQRGVWTRLAPRYWGLTGREYFDVADLWPLNPEGEILLMAIIETAEGVRNLPDILAEVKGIGAVWAGSGDLSVSLGHPLDIHHPEVEDGMQRILSACKDRNVPCGVLCLATEVETRIDQGFRIIFSMPTTSDEALAAGRRLAGSPELIG